jgi:hypothetical protein
MRPTGLAPNKPRKSSGTNHKQPPHAFFLFCRHERAKISERLPGLTPADVLLLLSHMWRSLDEESKARFKQEELKLLEDSPRPLDPPPQCPAPPPRPASLELPQLAPETFALQLPVSPPTVQQTPNESSRIVPPPQVVTKRFNVPRTSSRGGK